MQHCMLVTHVIEYNDINRKFIFSFCLNKIMLFIHHRCILLGSLFHIHDFRIDSNNFEYSNVCRKWTSQFSELIYKYEWWIKANILVWQEQQFMLSNLTTIIIMALANGTMLNLIQVLSPDICVLVYLLIFVTNVKFIHHQKCEHLFLIFAQ